MNQGVGLRSAPYMIPDTAWKHTWFTSDVAAHLRCRSTPDSTEPVGKAALSLYSITVGALLARIVEEAMVIKAEDDSRFAAARIGMQKSRDDAGWDRVKTRGSGIVANDLGKELVKTALQRVTERHGEAAATAE